MLTIILFILLFIVLPDLYIYFAVVKKHTRRKCFRLLYWLPSFLLLAGLAYILLCSSFTRPGMNWAGSYFFVLILICAPKLLYVLPSLIGLILRRISPLAAKLFNAMGAFLALASIIMLLYGRIEGYRHFQVKEITFISPALPAAFDGYRIVQFSDLHLGGWEGKEKEVGKLVELLNDQQGDIIVFTGDLVNYYSFELDTFHHILSRLSAPDGVYSILGNHDYATYHTWDTENGAEQDLERLKENERSMGWRLLLNENVRLIRGDTCIALLGVENDGHPPFPQLGDYRKAALGCEECFKILLSHDPSRWREHVLAKTDIQLTLSGHTHGMQFAIGSFSPAKWAYREAAGLYAEGNRALYVNVGSGSLLFPFRFGAWPEITVITLQKK